MSAMSSRTIERVPKTIEGVSDLQDEILSDDLREVVESMRVSYVNSLHSGPESLRRGAFRIVVASWFFDEKLLGLVHFVVFSVNL